MNITLSYHSTYEHLGSLSAYLQNLYPENPPIIIIVEPNGANCVWRSAKVKQQELREAFKKKVWNFPYFPKPTHPTRLVWKKKIKITWSKNHF